MPAWKKYLRLMIVSPIFFYGLCLVLVGSMVNYRLFRKNSVDQTMNRFTPPIDYFKEFRQPHEQFDQFKLRQCIDYHQKVVNYYEFERPGAYAMMGFCQALLGQKQKAIQSYRASTDINPNDFWPYYNLGLLHYKKNDYSEAVKYFKIALTKDIKVNMLILFSSKVYADVRLSSPLGLEYNFLEALKEGRRDAYIFLMESLKKKKDYDQLFEVAVLALKEKPGDEDIFYFYAGESAFYQKLYEKAVELFKMALSKNPRNPDVLSSLGACMQLTGNQEMAKKLIEASAQAYQEEGSLIERVLTSNVRFF